MDALFGFVGLAALVIGLIMVVIALIRKKPKKNAGIVTAAGFVLFVVGLALPSSNEIVKDEGSKVAVSKEKDGTSSESGEKDMNEKTKEKEKAQAEKEREKAEQEEVKKKSENADWFKTALPAFTDNNLELQEVSYKFITENSNLLPALDVAEVNKAKELTDATINIKHLNKNATPHFEKFLSATGSVINVEEDVIESGQTVAIVHVMDDDFNSHIVIIMKSTGDILEDDTVQFWGVPVGPYSFENVSGGYTNSQVYFGSHIEKK